MDGRTQLPVNEYLRRELEVDYVDTITEAGPVRILAEQQESATAQSILDRVDISVKKHGSKSVAVVSHYDCAGNPLEKDGQMRQLETATRWLSGKYPDIQIIGLWVDSAWMVTRIVWYNSCCPIL
jgi:hypothetical protein